MDLSHEVDGLSLDSQPSNLVLVELEVLRLVQADDTRPCQSSRSGQHYTILFVRMA